MDVGAGEVAAGAFGALLRRRRLVAGLTQEQLAERALVSRRSISDMERGVPRTPRRETVTLLADALGLSGRERATFAGAASRVGEPAPAGRAAASTAAPLVGRAGELALLERHLAGAGPPLLLLAGEPGIGKSRLLAEAARLGEGAGWAVLASGCQRPGGQEPYMPLLGALKDRLRGRTSPQLRADLHGCGWLVRLLPELAGGPVPPVPSGALPAEQERRLLFDAVARLLANVAGTRGTLLVLDDLQWAGADALALLATLLRAAPGVPLRLVGAYRDTEVQTREPLGVLLADLAHAGLVTHRRLAPLTPAAAATLLGGLLADADGALRARLLERAGGVPFFLISFAQGLREGEPDGGRDALPWAVEQSIRQRVAALPAGADAVLAMAAAVGREVPLALLATAMRLEGGQVLAACEAACRARLLEEHGAESYRFAHDVIREVLEGDLGAGRRALAHARLAATLEQVPGEPPVELLAYHYERAGDRDKAPYYLERAGDQAMAQAAHAAAEQRYRTVVELLVPLGRALDAARVREKLAGVLATVARFDEALATLAEAAGALHAAGDLEGTGRIASQMGHIHYTQGTVEEGVACLQPALERLEARGPSAGLAVVYSALAELNLFWGRWAQEVDAAERAVHVARLVGDERILARAELLRGTALRMMGREGDPLPVLLEAIRLAEAAGARACLCEALNDVGWFYADSGGFQAAARHFERALLLAEQAGDPVLMAASVAGLGQIACNQGEWERAHAAYARAAAIHRQIALSPSSCDTGALLVRMGELRLREGAWGEACGHLEEGRRIFDPVGKRAGLRWAQSLLAEHDILAGQPAVARERLVPLLDRWGMEEAMVSVWVLPVLAWAHLELGELDKAEEVIAGAIRRARAQSYQPALVDGLRVQALLALRRQRWAAAAGHLEEGLALARAMPYLYGEGRLLAVRGRLRLDRDQPALARESLEAALAIFRRLGARKDVERTEQMLSALG